MAPITNTTAMIKVQHQHKLTDIRLWQLISPTLPIGAYAYSQGLETAVHETWVNSDKQTLHWLSGILEHTMAHLDIPILARLYQAWQQSNETQLEVWNAYVLASREGAELQAEDIHLGSALARLLIELGLDQAHSWRQREDTSYLTMLALAASHWQIGLPQLCNGYLWSWAENQVAAAIKLIPLGQTQGQLILSELIPLIEQVTLTGLHITDDEIGNSLPGVAMASGLHENQYARLFRS